MRTVTKMKTANIMVGSVKIFEILTPLLFSGIFIPLYYFKIQDVS